MKRILPCLLLFATLACADMRGDMLLVLNKADGTLSMIDVASMKSVATIPVGEGPHEIAASTDGRVAVGVNYDTGPSPGTTLSVIDIATRKERRVVLPGLLRPHGIVASGRHFFFTATFANRVKFTPDGKRVLVSDPTGGKVLVYDAGTKELLKTIATAEGPSGIQLTPDGARAFIACAGARQVQVIDMKTLEITGSIPTGNVPDGLAYVPSATQ